MQLQDLKCKQAKVIENCACTGLFGRDSCFPFKQVVECATIVMPRQFEAIPQARKPSPENPSRFQVHTFDG